MLPLEHSLAGLVGLVGPAPVVLHLAGSESYDAATRTQTRADTRDVGVPGALVRAASRRDRLALPANVGASASLVVVVPTRALPAGLEPDTSDRATVAGARYEILDVRWKGLGGREFAVLTLGGRLTATEAP